MTNPLKSTEPVTEKKFIAVHGAVILTVILVAGSGLVAWGQTQKEIQHLAGRQDTVEHILENIRDAQAEHGAALRGLAVQNANLTRTQQRVLDAVERLDSRLDRSGDQR